MTQNTLSISTRIRLATAAVLAAFVGAAGAAGAQEPSPTLQEAGTWVNDVGDGAVEIYVCQDKASRLCGRIVWLKEPLNAEGVPKHDKYNPKAEMQNRPICGLPVLGNLARDSEGGFDEGWIYDPKAGKSYSASIRLSARDRLVVTGYLGLKFMGKSFTWTRAPADLPRCDGAPGIQPIGTGAKPAAKPAPGSAASAAAAPTKPKQPGTTSAASAGSAPTAKAATAKATTPGAAVKTTSAATATKATTATKPAANGTAASAAAKPVTAKATTATAAVPPKPKPAQKPVKAVATSAPAPSAAPPPQPAAKPAPKPVQEADDTATSWSSGQ